MLCKSKILYIVFLYNNITPFANLTKGAYFYFPETVMPSNAA